MATDTRNVQNPQPTLSTQMAKTILSSFESLAKFVALTPQQLELRQQARVRVAQPNKSPQGTELQSPIETQVLEVHTSFGFLQHLKVWRADGNEITVGWDELQAIKNERLGSQTLAVEIFPPTEDLVNEVNYRHLWEIPRGWNQLPLNLKW